jgi:hypothetical protein
VRYVFAVERRLPIVVAMRVTMLLEKGVIFVIH